MAFGITPRHSDTLTFDSLTPDEILIIGIETARKLTWQIGHISSNGFIAYTSFSMSSWSEQVTVTIVDRQLTIKSECSGSQMFDWGKNKSNIENFTLTFYSIQQALSSEEISLKFSELNFTLTDQTSNQINQPPKNARDKITNIFSIFIPTEGYFITPIIVNLNILVFILMTIAGVNILLPDNDSLIVWGANFRPVTLDGQWWRLLTCCFLHIGVVHLLMNMYALIYIGLLLESRLGSMRFLTAYLLTGIVASAASLYWHDLMISAGASGAIFGMYGVFLAMLTTNLIEKNARKAFLTSILVFVGYNLLSGLRGDIDNAAHIGGLISGLIVGYVFYFSLSKPTESILKYGTLAGLTALFLIATAFVYTFTSNDIVVYEKKMNEFAALEVKGLVVYSMFEESSTNQSLLDEIRINGIPSWKKSIQIIQEADKLEIPEIMRYRNKKLIEYCELRIKLYELLYKSIEENTQSYDLEMDSYNAQLEKLLKELGA